MNGIELARRYYLDEVAPGLAGVPHAAALLGDGSEVLGYDDEVSTDHDFGKRVQVFFPDRDTAGEFFAARLGFDPLDGVTVEDWLLTPTQILASLCRGAVFHDPSGELARRRSALAWYPDDVWRYALAAGWLKVGQEEHFLGRTGGAGDDLGSRILAARLVRELIRLAFLVSRRWAPYGKWLSRACTDLEIATELAPRLAEAVRASDWRARETAVMSAGALLARATNELALCEPQDPSARQFYTRDVRVLGAGRFTSALCEQITDPVLRGVLTRVGLNRSTPRIPGTIDQAVDSTDVLTNVDRFRRAGPLLGLTASGPGGGPPPGR